MSSGPLVMPPGIAPFVPTNLRAYFVALLIHPPAPVEMAPALFQAHQNYMRGHVEAGRYKAMGPLTDNNRIRGLMIIEAPSLEEARALAEGDPAVQAGVFMVEVHPAILPDLSPVVVQYAPR